MSKPIIILMDDVHLEGRDEEEQQLFALEINTKIKDIKLQNDIPIVICAGDIGEGIKGVQWASQFNAEIIYICGNHEFWSQDYYEVGRDIEKYIQENNKTNIHFLNNSSIILHGIRFIGSTLWTSIADYMPWYNKNHIVKYYAAMGDFRRIRANEWYNPQNETRLKNFLLYHGVEEEKINDLITNRFFNPLLQIEENHLAIDYILEELSQEFDGKTIVVSHHLPVYELWLKEKNISIEDLSGEVINNERAFYEAAKGNDGLYKNILMMGYYVNDLKEIMYSDAAPNYWFHGHLHHPVSKIFGNTKVISSPVGYKKQSSTIKYKTIDVANDKKWTSEYVKNAIENYPWNEKLLNNIRAAERSIVKFELAISIGTASAHDFEPILQLFQKQHANHLNDLKKEVSQWLKPFIEANHKNMNQEKIDFYIACKLSGILDMKVCNEKEEIKYKFPELIAAAINESSFLDEKTYMATNKNNLQYYHYKEWLKELQKIQIQISHYKKLLLQFCEHNNK